MSLYADYLTERTADLILEHDDGFATYRYINDGKTVYIVDIYTVPAMREKYVAAFLADQIVKEAKDRGCTELLGTVQPSAKGSALGLKVLLGYGMTLQSASNDCIIFRKDI